METNKLLTYTAMGIAGLVCLLFVLNLALNLFYRSPVMDICFILAAALVLWQSIETSFELR